MALDIHDQTALLDAVTVGADQPVAFFVGSPLSWDESGGVPDVTGMLNVARQVVAARLPHRVGDFNAALDGLAGAQAYQKAMSWVHGSLTQNGVNEVIRRAVWLARLSGRAPEFQGDGLAADWHLPRGARALGRLVATGGDRFPGPILTTNFDPLISLSIRAAGGVRRLRVIDADGGLPRTVETDPGETDVVHLHGYWKDASTLHTPAQLTSARPRLAASLRRLLSRCTLVVVGYGGWDDVFTSAIAEALHDQDARLTVLWCFRESDPKEIEHRHGHVLERLGLAITSGSLHLYGGIDCHSVFEEIGNALARSPGRALPAETSMVGWLRIDQSFLAQSRPLSDDDAVRYFDGAPPSWRHILSPSVPKRGVVAGVIERLRRVSEDRCSVSLIRGAGGEGKSTVLMQCAVEAAIGSEWEVLYRPDGRVSLSVDEVVALDPGKQWLLVMDEADNVAEAVFDCLRGLHNSARANVDFLLAARDADWRSARADAKPWRQVCLRLDDVLMRGLSGDDDARALVEAWAAFGERGLRSLAIEANPERRVELLKKNARNNADVGAGEGSFLGALLETRFSEPALREHVRDVLTRLSQEGVGSDRQTLCDAFLYVAACQSAGISGLDLNVLADLLDVPRAWVRTRVMGRLGEEAALVSSGDRAFTRHQRVADAAIVEADLSLNLDMSDFWARLIRQVVKTSRDIQVTHATHASVLHIGPRLQAALPAAIPNDRRAEIARIAALTAVQAMPGRLECIVDLSKTYREAGDYASAIRVLLDNLPTVTRKADFRDVIRGYWYEWSVCFGLSGKGASSAASNAAFAGVALSDAVGDVPLGSEQAMRICSGIGLAFGRLSEKVGSVVFARGRSASAWIGSHSSPDAKAEQFFRQHEAASLRMGVPLPTDIDEAVDWLREAIVESVRYIEDARLAGLIELDSMGFQGLRRVLERSRAK